MVICIAAARCRMGRVNRKEMMMIARMFTARPTTAMVVSCCRSSKTGAITFRSGKAAANVQPVLVIGLYEIQ